MTTARRTAFLVAAVYLFAPAHPDAFFRGIPLGLAPLVVLAAGVFAWFAFRDVPESPRTWTRVVALLACLLAVKIGVAFLAPPVGWVGRYYPNDRFAGPARRSTDFVRLDATRIDRAIDFKDDYFPVYFLNEADFNRGIRREVTLPVTSAWTGHVRPSSPVVLPLSVTVRGKATVSVDGQTVIVADSSSPQAHEVTLSPGDHQIDVTYLKPADTDPLIALRGFDPPGRGDLLVTPEPVSEWRRAAYRVTGVVALAADAMAALAFVVALWRLAVARRAEPVPGAGALVAVRRLCVSMFAIFLVQGVYAAVPYLHRAVSLSGGDDWLAFEARAREVVTGGLLMRFGRPFGAGEVFYYYPGYSYFLAGVHRLTGEDLSGVLFVHFILLFLANVAVFRIAEALFSRPIAIASTIALVGIEELAFMRHYTVTLLSENLYFLTVPLTVLGLVRFLQSGRRRPLVWAGLAAGVSAITRPAMMLFLVPAALIILAASVRGGQRYRSIAASLGVFIACWFGVVFLITLRNYVVAGQPILISESPAHSFILYNLPPTADARPHYMAMYSGGLRSAAQVMLRIIVDHPGDSLRGVTTKIGFSFGMIQWMGGSMHPELVLASALYLVALLSCSAARTMFTWPVHAFVAAHLVGMVLTMPSNYGYRLILPMYLFLPMFGARFVKAMMTWVGGRAPHALAVAPSGGQRP
jgi:hypothetical protein